jgi:hypothetical protein
MVDGRQACGAFADGLLGALGITGDDLIGWIYRQPQPRAAIASVARHIAAMAARGDWVAKGLMERASEHLSVLGHAVARQAGLSAPLRWSYAGGVFADAGLLRAVSMRMGSEPVLPRLPPVGGAILCAARTAGWAVDEAFVTTLSQSLGEEVFQENNPQSPTQIGQPLAPQSTAEVVTIDFSPTDNTLLASGARFPNTDVLLWNVATQTLIGEFTGQSEDGNTLKHKFGVLSVAFSPDGTLLASGGEDTDVFLWDTATRQSLVQLDFHLAAVNKVAFSPSGNTLASGSADSTIMVWDVSDRGHICFWAP